MACLGQKLDRAMTLRNTLGFIASHPLTKNRQLAAIGRLLSWQIRCRLQSEIEYPWIHGSKLRVRRGMTGATGNIYCGLHEFVDMAFLLHFLRLGDLFVDVGANIGSYTVLASAVAGADVVAVEPDPGSFASLQSNVELNGIQAKVKCVKAALGANSGSIKFSVGQDTMNRVLRTDEGIPYQVVPVQTLDSLLAGRSPIALKLDVEGFESEVLRGAARTLANPTLLAIETECDDAAVVSVLEAHGFTRRYYDPFTRQLGEASPHRQHNALYVRNIVVCLERVANAKPFEVLGRSI
jgi:FkbM family methyltransferase